MLQNHIGELESKPQKREYSLQDLPMSSRILITGPQLIIIFAALALAFITTEKLSLSPGLVLAIQIGLGVVIVACVYFIFKRRQFHKYEPIHQQEKYYQWGNVQPLNQRQLAAMQLIAFSRYKDGFWTDTLESQPVEVRLEHIPQFRNKLDYFAIATKEDVIAHWADSWGMVSRAKYEQLYDDLLNGLHTKEFVRDWQAHPEWKERILHLTELPEAYFDDCMRAFDGKPKRLIWAWDLWRAISLSAGAFSCGFISEKEAWERIYEVADISHYLFDDLGDFYNNMRLGHAYWANNEKMVFERKTRVDAFLNPEKGCERAVHAVKWPDVHEVKLPENMKNSFQELFNEKMGKPNPIGFRMNQGE